jgi:hypothetical protein
MDIVEKFYSDLEKIAEKIVREEFRDEISVAEFLKIYLFRLRCFKENKFQIKEQELIKSIKFQQKSTKNGKWSG